MSSVDKSFESEKLQSPSSLSLSSSSNLSEVLPISTREHSPGRMAESTSRFTNFISSPLRRSIEIDHSTNDDKLTEIVDEEISVNGRTMLGNNKSSGGLVASASLQIETASQELSGSNDVFFTPMASEEPIDQNIYRDMVLTRTTESLNPTNISKESVPEAMLLDGSELIALHSSPQRVSRQLPFTTTTTTTASATITSTAASTTIAPSQIIPGQSLLDWEGPFPLPGTPTSQPKYSERQWKELHRNWEHRFEKQSEFHQLEISHLESKYETTRKAAFEMRALLEEYDRTIEALLARRSSPTPDKVESNSSREYDLKLENQSLKISIANVKLQYEEAKSSLESLRLSEQNLLDVVTQLRQQLVEAQRNYDALVTHAQSRINEANDELQRLRTTLEIELSATKAKLSKAELRLASAESALEVKTRENKELTTICDELIMKIDGQPSTSSLTSTLSTGNVTKEAFNGTPTSAVHLFTRS